jgi:predicted dehydrogenase
MGIDRRTFLSTTAAAGVGLLGRPASANESVNVAVMGVNGRGAVLAKAFAAQPNANVVHVCEVDAEVAARVVSEVPGSSGLTDFRRALDSSDVDALVIAAPDHWHAPAAILALQAEKHVYLEKPCSHNPREGELLVAAQERSGRVIQMGNQQRSARTSIEVIDAIRSGLIGRPYFGRAWYANTRGSIGHGKPVPVPERLDYELWQGPAPRTPYRDNVIHYNWHWFWRWGTGEICNNGTHEIDVCRWALGVDYPTKVTSSGGRYHFDDDWEAYDTQVASFEFSGGQTITWEGRSCNGRPVEGRGRGASIHGEKGTVIMDRRGYVVYDLDNQEIRRNDDEADEDSLDTRGGGGMTSAHIANFLASIRGTETPRAPVADARKSQLLCHLGNIAQRTGHTLRCDEMTGRIVDDREAMKLWSREYEPSWEPQA